MGNGNRKCMDLAKVLYIYIYMDKRVTRTEMDAIAEDALYGFLRTRSESVQWAVMTEVNRLLNLLELFSFFIECRLI